MAGLEDFIAALRFGQQPNYGSPSQGGMGIPLDSLIGPYAGGPDAIPMQSNMPPFQPNYTQLNRLAGIDAAQPQRPSPSNMQRILAGVAGLDYWNDHNMVPLQDEILYGRFNRDTNDWMLKHKAATEAAELESRNNVNAGSLYNQELNRDIANRRASEYERRGNIAQQEANRKVEADRNKAEIDKRKVAVQEFKIRNPNHVFRVDENQDIYALNPQNPKEPPIKTGLKSGDLSDMEQFNLQLQKMITGAALQRGNIVLQGEIGKERDATPTVTTSTSTDAQGNTTTKETTTSKGGDNKPTGKKYSGKTVKMRGPNGEGPFDVPTEEIEDAKKNYGMIEVK